MYGCSSYNFILQTRKTVFLFLPSDLILELKRKVLLQIRTKSEYLKEMLSGGQTSTCQGPARRSGTLQLWPWRRGCGHGAWVSVQRETASKFLSTTNFLFEIFSFWVEAKRARCWRCVPGQAAALASPRRAGAGRRVPARGGEGRSRLCKMWISGFCL